MTGSDIVSASLRKIGAIGPGDTLDASEATDGLAELNRMISSWRTESLIAPIESYSTLSTENELPDGCEDALIYNLAIRLAPEYGKAISDAIAMTANETKANLKRAGHRTSLLTVDEAILYHSRGFNMTRGGI